MSAETTPPSRGPDPVPMPRSGFNKYVHVLETAVARKKRRGNLEDDYRKPHYEPATPPPRTSE